MTPETETPTSKKAFSDDELRVVFENMAIDHFDLPDTGEGPTRLSNGSYQEPNIAKAWRWFKRGYNLIKHQGETMGLFMSTDPSVHVAQLQHNIKTMREDQAKKDAAMKARMDLALTHLKDRLANAQVKVQVQKAYTQFEADVKNIRQSM